MRFPSNEGIKKGYPLKIGSCGYWWGFRGEGRQTRVGYSQKTAILSNLSRHVFGTFRNNANITTQRQEVGYRIDFPMALKCVTLNDRQMPFYAKSVFCVGLTLLLSETKYVKARTVPIVNITIALLFWFCISGHRFTSS